jgi:hypothetical protein
LELSGRELELIPRASAFDHLLCNPNLPGGCARCGPLPALICCDLCEPNAFVFNNIPEEASLPLTRAPNRVHIKPYNPMDADIGLREELRTWRMEVAKSLFPSSAVRTCGPALFMPNSTFERILGLAHDRKLTSIKALMQQLRWSSDYIKLHGQKLLDIVNKHRPQAIVIVAPVASTDGSNTLAARKTRAAPCCRKCRKPGHNCKW